MLSKNQALMVKRGKFELTDHGKKIHNHLPYAYNTPEKPRIASNVKRPTKTYNCGVVPAFHSIDIHAKKDFNELSKNHKMEMEMRINKNKKFSENRLKLLAAHGYQQYN